MNPASSSARRPFSWKAFQRVLSRAFRWPWIWLRFYWNAFSSLQNVNPPEADERGQLEEVDPLRSVGVVSSRHDEPNPWEGNRASGPSDGVIFAHRVSDIPSVVVKYPTPKGTDEGSDTSPISPEVPSRRRVHSVTGLGGNENGQDLSHTGSLFLQGEETLEKEIMELQSDFFKVREEWPKEGNQYFIPAKALRRLVTVNAILSQLRHSRPDIPNQELQEMAKRACQSAYKLFAILVCANKSNKFYEFLDEGLCDADLPFRRSPGSGDDEELCSNQAPYNTIQSMKCWGLYQVSNFSRDQWQMLSPIFRKSNEVEHYELQNNHVLPFIEDHEQDHPGQFTGSGGYSSVWAVTMHPDHQFLMHQLTKVPNPRLAIKRLHSIDAKVFEVEVEMLKAFSNHSNPHLIKLLATYQWRGRYHLVFPYAKSNLRKYWQDIGTPNFSRTTIYWMLCQCKGVAAGLYAIHEYKNSERKQQATQEQATLGSDLPHRRANKESRFGRHGDIKPENILWYDEDRDHGLGILCIADFGLMEFHREDTRSKVKPDGVVGSPTYAPPELELRLPISPAYDIWSLGCVFLEFAIWLVVGWQQLHEFPDARAFTVANGFNADTFFTIKNADGSKPYAIVAPGVSKLIETLHNLPRSTAFVHEFLDLISKEMLVVEASDRIKCGELNKKLTDMLHRVKQDPEYLTRPTPWKAEQHRTVSTDLVPSGTLFGSPPPTPTEGNALPRSTHAVDVRVTWMPSPSVANRTLPHRNSTIP